MAVYRCPPRKPFQKAMGDVLDQEFREFAGPTCAGVLRALSRTLGTSVRLLDAEGRPIVPASLTGDPPSSDARPHTARVPILLPASRVGGWSRLAIKANERCLGYLTAEVATPETPPLLADLATELVRLFQADLECDAEIDAIGTLRAEIDLLDRMARARGPVRDLAAAARGLLAEHSDLLIRARLVACLTWRAKAVWITPGPIDGDTSRWGAGPPTALQEETVHAILSELAPVAISGGDPVLLRHRIKEPAGWVEGAFASLTDGAAMIGFVGILGAGPDQPLEPSDLTVLRCLAGELSHAAVRHGRHRELRDMLFNTIRSLVAAIDAKDEYTRGHSERVHRLALRVGRALGLPAADLRRLSWAALLYDVGKIATPGEVLAKRSHLAEEEERLLRAHPVQGCELLEPIPQLHSILPAIRHHHERYDGGGFPDGLAGNGIPLPARIIAVAEAFDAMVHAPDPATGADATEALRAIEEGAGTRFDPGVVQALLQVMRAEVGAADPSAHEEEELLPPDLQSDDGEDMAA